MKRALLAIALLSISACAGQQSVEHGVVNLVQVRADVYRSGQPTADGMQYLRGLGIRHVIKLNFDDESPETGAFEAGIEVHRVSIQPSTKGIDIFARPSHEAMDALWKLAERILYAQGSEGAWLVHCQNGHDRTGLVVGMIRMVVDGWTPEQAWAEMLARGYHDELVGLNWAFRQFAERVQR